MQTVDTIVSRTQRLPNYSLCRPLLLKGGIKQCFEDGFQHVSSKGCSIFSRMRSCRRLNSHELTLNSASNYSPKPNHPSLSMCVFSLLLCSRCYWPLCGRCGSVRVHVQLGDILHIHLRRRKHILGIKCVGHSLHGFVIVQTFAKG